MTGWHFWIGTGDLVTWRPGNSGSNLAPSGGQRHLVATIYVYKVKFSYVEISGLRATDWDAALALEQHPNNKTSIKD